MRLGTMPLFRWLLDPPVPTVEIPVPEAIPVESLEAVAFVERRASERYPCHREAWLHPVSIVKLPPWHAIVMDLSTHGIGLAVERPVCKGTFFAVELPDPLLGNTKVVRAHVIHATRLAHNYYHVGCRLMTPIAPDEVESLLL